MGNWRSHLRRALFAALLVLPHDALAADARAANEPVRLRWQEGDVSGFTPIHSPDGDAVIGFIEYSQSRQGDLLTMRRVSRFQDGSSDEDEAEAYVGQTLRAVRGRSITRDTNGRATVDLSINVPDGRIAGFTDINGAYETFDEHAPLLPATYWGPLVFIVLKNFDDNAAHGRLRFRTVAPTPTPRVFSLEIRRQGTARLARPGGIVDAVRFSLQPTFNRLLDPLILLFVPDTTFLVVPSSPPALAGFIGPRNYSGQEIRLE